MNLRLTSWGLAVIVGAGCTGSISDPITGHGGVDPSKPPAGAIDASPPGADGMGNAGDAPPAADASLPPRDDAKPPPPPGSDGAVPPPLGDAGIPPMDDSGGIPPPPFDPLSAAASVTKVKNLLTGLAPTQAEIDAVVKDPQGLAGLVDAWMKLPAYEEKMEIFFVDAFQQSQASQTSFKSVIDDGTFSPNDGLLLNFR